MGLKTVYRRIAGVALGSIMTFPAMAQNSAAKSAPGNLQGVWSNATTTPLERPKNLGSKEFYTDDEIAAMAKKAEERASTPRVTEPGSRADVHYDGGQFGLDVRETASNRRTSLIVGPTGTVPPLMPEAQKRAAERTAKNQGHQFDGPENRGLSERCLLWPTEAPPMLSPGYNSNLEIVQGAGYVAIMQEMIHSVRVIPTDGSAHLPSNIRSWMGDSRGHWEGKTLVVDTTNFTDKNPFHGSSQNMHLVERFTRKDDNTLLYEFTVSDPSTWEKSWSAEVPWVKTAGPIYEYACHEANYGMANILSGARAEENGFKDSPK